MGYVISLFSDLDSAKLSTKMVEKAFRKAKCEVAQTKQAIVT